MPVASGDGAIALSALPNNCETTSATNYTGLTGNDTLTVNVMVVCTAPAGSGVIMGTVWSGLGATSGVSVIATPRGGSARPAVTTNSSGAYTLSGVPAGDGAITVSGLPAWCTTPSATPYAGVTSGDTIDINVTVSCVAPTGTVSGAITSSLGGGLAGVGVVVTPTGGTALPPVVTSNAGTYTVHGVPVGGGSVTLTSGLPATCPTSSATPYTGVQYAGTVTTNVNVSCVVAGTLAITVRKLPLGESVSVTGPNGYSRSVTGNTLLNGLLPGSYTVAPVPAIYIPDDSVVSPIYRPTVTGSPATVVSNAVDTAKVAFPHNGTGYLYMGWGNAAFAPFTSAQLRSDATSPTNALISIPGSTADPLAAIAIDAQGTIWTAVSFDPNLHGTTGARFDSGTVSVSDITIPNVVPSGRTIKAMAFDASGNLWFASFTHVDALTPAQLAARDASSPAYALMAPSYALESMAFDASGNLWIAGGQGAGSQLLEFTASQLTAGGTPTPKTMMLPQTLLGCIAFDAGGVMWLCDQSYTGGILGYTPSQLAGGDTVPTYRIPFDSTTAALTLAFDATGDLWVQEFTTGNTYPLVEYLGSSLESGSPVVLRSTVMSSPMSTMAFDPTPAGLPINGSRVPPHAPTVRRTGVATRR